MDRKTLLISAGLICILFISAFIFISFAVNLVSEISEPVEYHDNSSFNNSTPELTAVSIAKLNFGTAFNDVSVGDVYLIDGYWIVGIDTHDVGGYLEVTVNAKTLMSKRSDEGAWRSLDELKAIYIAGIQLGYPTEKPQKITMNGKEIWKVPVNTYSYYYNGTEIFEYVYVDLATGKSKNTLGEFNKAAGADGWLTLKEVDDVINKGDYKSEDQVNLKQTPFRNVLRDLYSE